MLKPASTRRWLLSAALAIAGTGLHAGSQVTNGDFKDANFFGDDIGWTETGVASEYHYASPGQTGAGNCLYMTANNADTLTEISQDVGPIASGSNVPFLDFWYVAQGGDNSSTANGGQRVQILNTSNVVQATVLDINQNNSFNWVHVMQNVSAYVGQTIRLAFMARGSAGHGATFYLDSIQINYATYTPTNTPTRTITKTSTITATSTRSPTSTVTPTSTASPSITPSPSITLTSTPTPPPSQVQNGGFEIGSGYDSWTADPSLAQMQIKGPGSDGAGQCAYVQGYGGANYSALQQVVHVDNVGNPQLIFWYESLFGSGDTSQAYSFFDIRTPSDTLLQRIVAVSRRDTSWNQVTFDLSSYVGQDIKLVFGAAVPGSQVIAIEVDNVSIYYGTPTITPSITVTSTFTPTATPTRTTTQTNTLTATQTFTATATPTRTITATATATATATPSCTITRTHSVTPTYSASPTITKTSTVTPTLTVTPPFLHNGLGRNIAAPVPARGHDDVCIYFQRQPAQSQWKVFNVAGESVAQLQFGSEYSQCWNHRSMAAGIYILVLDTTFADGTTEKDYQKLALLP